MLPTAKLIAKLTVKQAKILTNCTAAEEGVPNNPLCLLPSKEAPPSCSLIFPTLLQPVCHIFDSSSLHDELHIVIIDWAFLFILNLFFKACHQVLIHFCIKDQKQADMLS